MNLEQFKTTIGPRGCELLSVIACLTQVHAQIESDEAFELIRDLAEACLAKQWAIDPIVIAAACVFLDAQLDHQNWEFTIIKSGDKLDAKIRFLP